jgi:ketosteroid isomerase-like protein
VIDPLRAARTFMKALENKDPQGAASVVADDVVIELPGGENELKGKDGTRQLMRMAPPFVRTVREESVDGNTVTLKGLTRAPGQFANYTTWTFETRDGLITRVRFMWRPAN